MLAELMTGGEKRHAGEVLGRRSGRREVMRGQVRSAVGRKEERDQ